MAFDKKTFSIRTSSALVFAAVVLGCMYFNVWTFFTLFLFITFIALREFILLIESIYKTIFENIEKLFFIISGLCFYVFVSLYHMHQNENAISVQTHLFSFYFLGISIGFATMLFFRKNKNLRYLLLGISYISCGFALFVQLRHAALILPFLLLSCIWANDTFAYLGGSFFGRTKIFPTISPNKTWEGTLFGVLMTVFLGIVFSFFIKEISLVKGILFALSAGIMGTFGDAAESQLKRWANVKDSGQLMPGHGGALDRFDSLLFAAPVAFLVNMFL